MLNIHSSNTSLKICTHCIYDERVSSISFDEAGVCSYCHMIESLTHEYGTGSSKGEELFRHIVDDIKRDGRGKPYDLIVGVSGGTDSSYMLWKAIELGLRPLAVHYDNTWNSSTATQNIYKMVHALNIDLYTNVVNNKEIDDIYKAFFISGVPEIEASTDLGYAETLNRAASKYGLHYIFEGHSFVTEGITPLGRNYFDGRYIQEIHRQYGKIPMKTYPLMTLFRFLWGAMVTRTRKIRPFWYLDYSKEAAREFLQKKFDWKYYGGHHLENRMASFYHSVYLPQKFGTDMRNNTLSARVRNGTLSRAEAWAEYNTPPLVEGELVSYFKKRLDLSDEEYERIMKQSPKNWTDYPTYKKRFELLRPLFFLLAKANLVPMSFYLKYCFPANPPA